MAPKTQNMPSTKSFLQKADDALMYVVTRPEKVMVRGKGSYLWDSEGKKYLDFIQGWAVNCLGHCPPSVSRAISRQSKELINGSPWLYNDAMIEYADLLVKNSCMDRVFFASSGSEAIEGAIKLARKYGSTMLKPAFEIITTTNSFHGRTLAAMSASGKASFGPLFEPKVPGFIHVPFNDLEAVRNAIGPNTCAVMLEPIQGEGGVIMPSKDYIQGLRKTCYEAGVLLIFDEIQTGFGRTGTLFAYEQWGVEPDIMTLAKGMGGGFPVSALMAKKAYALFEAGEQGGTYCAQPLAMAAGKAVLTELIEKKIPAKAASRGKYLKKKLKVLAETHGLSNLRGMGLLVGVDLPADKGPDVVNEAFAQGLIINAPGPGSLRFIPALNVTNAQVDEMIAILDKVLKKVL